MNHNRLFFVFIFSINTFLLSTGFASTSISDGQGIAYYRAGFPQIAKPLLISEIETTPSTLAETCYNLGNIYFSENQKDSAEFYFKKGITANPDNSLNAVGLTMLKIKSTPDIAEQEFKKLLQLKQNKKDVDIYLAISNAYLFNGVLDQALIYQEKAKSIKTKYALVYVVLGDIELAKKNVGNACSNYELAIYYDDKCKEAYIKYARAYKNANPSLAIEKLSILKSKEPSFLLADREMADIYYAKNDFAKAAELYESYLKSGNSNVQDLTKYAFTLFLNGQFDKSLEVSNLGLAKAPRNPVFNRLSMYNNVELKKPNDALKAADLFFNYTDKPEFTFLDYRYYGQAYRDLDSIYLAIPQYEKAIQLDSTRIELWKDVSDMYSKKNNYRKSVVAYTKYMNSLKTEAKTPDVYMQLSKMYYGLGTADTTLNVADKKSALLKADSLFGEVALKEPTVYRGNFWRARTNSALDPETTQGLAKPYYEKTAALLETKADPKYNQILMECYSYLGYYLYLQKDYQGSIAILNKNLVLDPTNAKAKKSIEEITKEMMKKKK